MHPLPAVGLLLATFLCGCASDDVASRALQAVGVDKARALPEAQLGARSIALRLHAAPRLNLDVQGRPLALVVRIYALRQSAAFNAAPYAAFLSPETERAALGDDLVAVSERTLVPGQRLDMIEQLAREATYLGIVALFHAPAAQRWRLAFKASEAETAGLTIGAHACALSAGAGAAPLAALDAASGSPSAAAAGAASATARCQ